MKSLLLAVAILLIPAVEGMAEVPDLSGTWQTGPNNRHYHPAHHLLEVVQSKDIAKWQHEDPTCLYSTTVTWDGTRFVGMCARRHKASDCVTCLKVVVTVKDALSATVEESAMDERCDVKLSHRVTFEMHRHFDQPAPWLARPGRGDASGAMLDESWLTHANNGKEANELLLANIRRATEAASARADTKTCDALKKAEADLLSRGLPPIGIPDLWDGYRAYIGRRRRSEAALAEQYVAVADRLAKEHKFEEAASVDRERKALRLVPSQVEPPSSEGVALQYEGALRRPRDGQDLPTMREAWAAHDTAVKQAADELAKTIETEIGRRLKAIDSADVDGKAKLQRDVEQFRDALAALACCGSLPTLEPLQGARHAAEDKFLVAAEIFVRRFEDSARAVPAGPAGTQGDVQLATRVKQELDIFQVQLAKFRDAKNKREQERLSLETQTLAMERARSGPGLLAEYFVGTDLNPGQRVLTRVDLELSRDFKKTPVGGRVPQQNFSVRWSGFVTPTTTDSYTFHGYSDDGIRITVDGRVVLDEWRGRAAGFASKPIDLKAGESQPITIEYFDGGQGQASLWLDWQGKDVPRERLPARCLSPRKGRDAKDGVELCELTVVPSQPVTVEPLTPGAARLSGGYTPPFEAVSAHLHGAEFLRVEWQQTEAYDVTVTKPGLLYLVGEDESLLKDPSRKWESADAELAGPFIKARNRTYVTAGESFKCKGFEVTLVAKKIVLKK